jgi:hypothetical protein
MMMTLVAPLTFIASSTYATFSITLIGPPCLPERAVAKGKSCMATVKIPGGEGDTLCFLAHYFARGSQGCFFMVPVLKCVAHEK